MTSSSKVSVLGVGVTAFDLPTAVATMASAIEAGARTYACTCPVYTLMQAFDRAEVHQALDRADWVTPDGMPIVWALRWRGARAVGRVYGPDLMLQLSAVSAQQGYRQFYLGGGPGVAADLAEAMRQRFPALRLAGTLGPPFRSLTEEEEASMIDQINQSGAHILWVGLGSPKQDLWMERYRPRLVTPLIVGVGAAFDFYTGRQAQAPRWMQRNGIEWLFRLANNPRRLWRRYFLSNPKFLVHLALQLTGLRRYD